MNSYSSGKSGADLVLLKILKSLPNPKILITSTLGQALAREEDYQGDFLLTSKEKSFHHILPTYLKRTVKALKAKITISPGDLLLSSSDFFPDVVPAYTLKKRHPQALWVQHIFHLVPHRRLLASLLQRLSFLFIRSLADAIIVDNFLLKQDLIKLKFPSSKIHLNYPGLDLSISPLPPSSPRYDALFLGQIRQSKGVLDLIQIWSLVCQDLPQACLALVGQSQPRFVKLLKKQIKSLGLTKNIMLLGYLSPSKLETVFSQSKIFVLASREEGFGLAPLEAQARGLPVVAWDLPVFTEIFPTGMLKTPCFSLSNFSQKVLKLLENPKLFNKLSQEAKANPLRFSWDSTVKREKEIIKNLYNPSP